ncbi:DUF4132 domain-containing protein [Massilia genomosp. 1]|uniref:DUF4132 domain-containing protein n=1 Tax=Massilia genomosp. 1 TaxID=2609280 RepID=A0ABX0MUX1_9BURK|nr:DUF4132 domain-containing protein [Massilia genomosp. 1]NHZ66525.1 DUF4132 domain-containing protein [Massilia genomosp. 1]
MPHTSTLVPPWLGAGPLIELSPSLAGAALPSRRFPGAPPPQDAGVAWATYIAHARRKCDFMGMFAKHPEAAERVAHDVREGSFDSDVVLLAGQTVFESDLQRAQGSPFIDFLVASKGLPYALQVLLELETFWIYSFMGSVNLYICDGDGKRLSTMHATFCATELALRAHLAVADAAIYAQCVQMIRSAVPTLHPCRQPLLGVLLPDEPALSDQLALLPAILAHDQSAAWLRLTATAPASLAALSGLSAREGHWYQMYHATPAAVASAVRERGVDAVTLLQDGAAIAAAGRALACIGTPASMRAMALACDVNKNAAVRFSKAAQRWPLAAIAALSELVADGAGPASARTVLTALAHTHARSLPDFAPWISPGAARVLAQIGAQAGGGTPADDAGTAGLPPVLASPPWLAPVKKSSAALVLAPLALAPVERWNASEREAMLGLSAPGYTPAGVLKDPLMAARILGIANGPYAQQAASAIANADAPALMAAWRSAHGPDGRMSGWMLAGLPEPMNEQVWNALDGLEISGTARVISTLGLRGMPGLVASCERRPAQELRHARYFGAVELAAPMARACATLKPGAPRSAARDWLLANPEHAACALIAPALGKPGAARDQARAALLLIAGAGHAPLLMQVAARYEQAKVQAALRALLDQDPLDRHPAKIARLPDFWQPQGWTRPRLAASGQPLPVASLEHIGVMLRFPHADGVYAGVDQVRQACSGESLAAFAWDAFRAWTDAGSESREGWIFSALGLVGNDATARKLAPLIRAWPGEGQHARAVAGLDVLARIGSDTALVLLNGIAQKVKFKALQERAREKIAELAAARGLTSEELEDRLAPDLGLDAQGTLRLDFGPRAFLVGFDEALKPCVRDADGKRLSDLPKPNKGDDAALADAAVARFKLLKKDARTIAAQQVQRLEVAMCMRRRWDAQVFHTFLAGHPLLRHLVQRIVWGAWEAAGPRLLGCFRVAPDGALTDAADDAYALPPGALIGIPHALDLPAADAAAFGALLADYELTQPFAQIGRDTYTLSDAEKASGRLLRWNGAAVPTGRVLGLAGKGWRRGTPEGGGLIANVFKFIAPGRIAVLWLEPGIHADAAGSAAEQRLCELVTGEGDKWGSVGTAEALSALDPIAASELIRDMQALCA